MRVLLDECVPRKLRRELPGHTVTTVGERGWAGLQNGDLLRRAREEFDVFLTVDQNVRFQQNLDGSEFVVVVLVSVSNDIAALRPLMESARELLRTAPEPGVYEVAVGWSAEPE